MKEARQLLEDGRLVVVPATGVGCVHPGHGPLEQLLTESANGVAGLRGSGKSNEVPIGLIPYSPDAPFDLLADIAQAQQGELRKLRRLLIRRTRELAPNEAGIVARREARNRPWLSVFSTQRPLEKRPLLSVSLALEIGTPAF